MQVFVAFSQNENETLHCFIHCSLLLCRELFRERYCVKGQNRNPNLGAPQWVPFIHDDFIAVDLQLNYRQMMIKPEPLSSTVRCSLISL